MGTVGDAIQDGNADSLVSRGCRGCPDDVIQRSHPPRQPSPAAAAPPRGASERSSEIRIEEGDLKYAVGVTTNLGCDDSIKGSICSGLALGDVSRSKRREMNFRQWRHFE